MALEYDGQRIGVMQYNGVTIGEAMMDGQVVYQSTVKLTGTSGMTSRYQLRDAVAARGLDYRTITHLPFKIDTSQATSLLDLFNGWTALVVAPEMTTLQVTDMGGLFRGCTALEYVGDLQTSNVTNAGFMFDACAALTDGNVRLLGKHPNVSTTAMIANSGLTYEPWYNADGSPLRYSASGSGGEIQLDRNKWHTIATHTVNAVGVTSGTWDPLWNSAVGNYTYIARVLVNGVVIAEHSQYNPGRTPWQQQVVIPQRAVSPGDVFEFRVFGVDYIAAGRRRLSSWSWSLS